MDKLRKVYFGMNGQYGDIIMQEPGLRKFIADNPDTKIILGCSEKYKEILPLFYNYHKNIIDYVFWEGYDDWPTEKDKRYIESQNFDAMFPSKKPEHTSDDYYKKHMVIATALMLGVTADNTEVRLNLPNDIKRYNKTVSIGLFPSDWKRAGIKSLDISTIVQIVQYIKSFGYTVIHLNGPDEPDIPNTVKVNGTYFESVKTMLGTDFLISADTGICWAASAYQHPTIGLFGWGCEPRLGTSKNWQPINPNASYLEAINCNSIDIGSIFKEIDKKIL